MRNNIAVIVGSLRHGSYNRMLAITAIQLAPPELQLTMVEISQLPLYSEDLDTQLPSSVVAFKSAIAQADAVLVVTPEYNRSVPGVLKNAIDWATRPDNQNNWAGKPVGIMGASTGQFGTINAQFDLRKIFTHTGSLVMPQPQVLVTNVEQKLTNGQFDTKTREVVGRYLTAFAAWVNKMAEPKSSSLKTIG